MEEYLDESIKVCKNKTFGESYDKEWALKADIEEMEAKNMIDKGIDITIISECTGLTVDEIKTLKE